MVSVLVPSPAIALKSYLQTVAAVTGLVGSADKIVYGPVPANQRALMPQNFISLHSAGFFESSMEYPYWKQRVQISHYGRTPYQAHLSAMTVIGVLQGLNNIVLLSDEGVQTRLTSIAHEAGPLEIVDEELMNTPMEVTFWSVGAIRAAVG